VARPATILDVDGTLVDTNYHHAIAWYRALRLHGHVAALTEVHRHIGMGGDQMVAAMAGDELEAEHGDDVRMAESAYYAQLITEVEPLEGARDLILALRKRGGVVILASSAKEDEIDHYLDLLDGRDIVDGWTSSADVEQTKPEPDLVVAAVEKAGGGEAVMIGDSIWDCEAAGNAGLQTVAVLTGGYSEAELREAGAVGVFRTLHDLIDRLDETPLR
jgi:HAD superfamily hydrolase (TIGR01509 family)